MKEGDSISGSNYGRIFRISTWGESHGKAIGVVIDGCPSGLLLCEEDIQIELDKRKPSSYKHSTKRKEEDKVTILSGVFQGKTTGTPISLMVFNNDYISKDYSNIKDIYRPSHADYTYDKKYGIRDYRGGGRASGRETVARVCAGAIAKKILRELNIQVIGYVKSIGNISMETKDIDYIDKNPLKMACPLAYKKAEAYLEKIVNYKDSIGGVIALEVKGLKAGIGEPVFEKLDAMISMALMSIGATKGIEFGLGFSSSNTRGSLYNDEFYYDDNELKKSSNNSGGILGGLSDGFDININLAFKPTPSIAKEQNTVDKNMKNRKIEIKGRHDSFILPRALPVAEAMVCITLVDYILLNLTTKMESIKSGYFNF